MHFKQFTAFVLMLSFFHLFYFAEIMFIDHQTGNKTYFKRQNNLAITAVENYGKTVEAHGLREGKRTDNTYKYQGPVVRKPVKS